MDGGLTIPDNPTGLVILTSPPPPGGAEDSRGRCVSQILNRYDLATFSPSLGTPAVPESLTRDIRNFDKRRGKKSSGIALSSLPVGCFSFGRDIGDLLLRVAEQPGKVKALVFCGSKITGMTDVLKRITIPVLFIAAGRDQPGYLSNQAALLHLNNNAALNVVSRASQQFDEIGALEECAQLAALWFSRHLE